MNGGWKTEPRWKGCAADGGRARREWKRGEGRVCVRARVGGEREKAREKERESGEHAAKRVIESRARSLLYRPPYAYPVPFSQHPTPYSPFLSPSSVSTSRYQPPDTAARVTFSYPPPIFLHPSSFSDDRLRDDTSRRRRSSRKREKKGRKGIIKIIG